MPPLLVLTDRKQAASAGRSLVDTVRAAVDAGAPAVLFREKDLPAGERRRLAEQVAAAVAGAGVRLLVASDLALARSLAAGLHLAASDPWPPTELGQETGAFAPVSGTGTGPVGRSCHSVGDVARAGEHGATYVTLSPVYATGSKPGYGPALSPEALTAAAQLCDAPPVYALGGVGPEQARACIVAGAGGIAVMGAVMASDAPAEVVAALLRAVAATA